MIPPSPDILMRSLRCTICPACGQSKRSRRSFCFSCFIRLPRKFQQWLYSRFNEGYAESVSEALAVLHVTTPHWPPVPEHDPEIDIVTIPDAQARNLVLGAIARGPKPTTILSLQDLHLPRTQLTRMLHGLVESEDMTPS